MKTMKPSFELIDAVNGEEVLRKIERCGRVCYKSEDRIAEGSAERFVRNVIARGHESVIEHVSITGMFVCDRGVSHEIVRHRIASYSQESTRYCNYTQGKFGKELTFIEPCFWNDKSVKDYEAHKKNWINACIEAERRYFRAIEHDATPEQARSMLPNSLKTELVMTANLREWRHFFSLRYSERSHPQMREVALIALRVMHDAVPVVFDDLWNECGNADAKGERHESKT